MWTLTATSYKLRSYQVENGYEQKLPYDAVVDVHMLGDNKAYLHGALRKDGKALSREDYRGIAQRLQEIGVTHVLAERHGKPVEWLVSSFL